MTQLIRYEAARNALQVASTVDEVKDIRDKSEAMAAYARQAKDTELLKWATEIKVRAERRAGQMLAEMPKNPGKLRNSSLSHDATATAEPPTLDALGVTRSDSSRWQKLAAIDEEKFEAAVAAAKDLSGEVTTAAMLRAANGKPHVAHNSGENEWYTPAEIIGLARAVMGCIDTDPATSEIANQTVKAGRIYTADDDGRGREWVGNVWMNPPYAQPLVGDFAEAATAKYAAGEYKQACILVNNATETRWFCRMLEEAAAICFPKSRIKFVGPEGEKGSPLQGQAIIYFGERRNAFIREFSKIGFVLVRP